MLRFWMIFGSVALIVAPVAFAIMAAIEARRILRFSRRGIAVEGEIIGEELHGVRHRAPYPVVQFRTPDGAIHQFRSTISRRSRGFTHPEKVIVRYLCATPETAELFSGFHPYKHLAAIVVVLMLSIAFAAFGLPLILSR